MNLFVIFGKENINMPNDFESMLGGWKVIVSPEVMKVLQKETAKSTVGSNVNARRYPGIKAIYPNPTKRVVAVKFMDDEVRTATCDKDDNFDINVGVAICIASYLYGGKKNFHKIVSKKTK